jgi:hypothetical protein
MSVARSLFQGQQSLARHTGEALLISPRYQHSTGPRSGLIQIDHNCKEIGPPRIAALIALRPGNLFFRREYSATPSPSAMSFGRSQHETRIK